jgi:hypothetical protein
VHSYSTVPRALLLYSIHDLTHTSNVCAFVKDGGKKKYKKMMTDALNEEMHRGKTRTVGLPTRCQMSERMVHATRTRVRTAHNGAYRHMREIRRLLSAPSRLLLRLRYLVQVGGPRPILLVEREDTPRARDRRCRGCG